MDGNGRWAESNNEKRISGHKKGVETVKIITEESVKIGIKYLTLYTFSNDNWKRPKTEVIALMKLLVDSLNEHLLLLRENNIKLSVIGDMDKLDIITYNKLKSVIDETKKNNGMVLNLAISYGGRQEIIFAVNKILKNENVKNINEKKFNEYLYTSNIPDPDFLIRTGGDSRISNFLLWQIAYAEIYFSNKFWPEFSKEDLKKAIKNYQNRERRYGEIAQ